MRNIFLQYLYEKRKLLAVSATFLLIFIIVFFLYDVPIEAALYAGGLCAVLDVGVILISFAGFKKRCHERRDLLDNILLSTEKMPEPITKAEDDFIQMIDKLRHANSDALRRYDLERSESIDYFATWVHQIKTPISVMRMILQSEDTEENRELLSELFRIEQYAQMALSYFRLDTASSDFVFAEYDLDSIVRNAIRKFAPQFVRKRISLKFTPSEEKVLTDEKWLTFIIEQLLSNAIKYTESGSVAISCENSVLSISDTGIGIAQEDLPRIFEKGFTGYNGRADKKSTGIGLYLCKKAAQKLSHKIYAQSEPEVGSTFFIDMKIERLNPE